MLRNSGLTKLVGLSLLLLPTLVSAQRAYYELDYPCRVVDTRVKTKTLCYDSDFDGTFSDWECLLGVPGNGTLQFILAGDSTRVGIKNRGYSPEVPFTIGDQGSSNANGCGIDRGAKAIQMTIAALPLGRRGHLRIYPFEVTRYINGIPILRAPPMASSLNWSTGTQVVSTALTTRICNPETAPHNDCNEDITIFSTTNAHVVIDVLGYFK